MISVNEAGGEEIEPQGAAHRPKEEKTLSCAMGDTGGSDEDQTEAYHNSDRDLHPPAGPPCSEYRFSTE
jgi:hypothetical protein